MAVNRPESESIYSVHPEFLAKVLKGPPTCTVCAHVILHSRKLSREKTFANFMVLWLLAKVFSAKFGGVVPLALQK